MADTWQLFVFSAVVRELKTPPIHHHEWYAPPHPTRTRYSWVVPRNNICPLPPAGLSETSGSCSTKRGNAIWNCNAQMNGWYQKLHFCHVVCLYCMYHAQNSTKRALHQLVSDPKERSYSYITLTWKWQMVFSWRIHPHGFLVYSNRAVELFLHPRLFDHSWKWPTIVNIRQLTVCHLAASVTTVRVREHHLYKSIEHQAKNSGLPKPIPPDTILHHTADPEQQVPTRSVCHWNSIGRFSKARLPVWHNSALLQDDVEIVGQTGRVTQFSNMDYSCTPTDEPSTTIRLSCKQIIRFRVGVKCLSLVQCCQLIWFLQQHPNVTPFSEEPKDSLWVWKAGGVSTKIQQQYFKDTKSLEHRGHTRTSLQLTIPVFPDVWCSFSVNCTIFG